jgi:hypothetical protein
MAAELTSMNKTTKWSILDWCGGGGPRGLISPTSSMICAAVIRDSRDLSSCSSRLLATEGSAAASTTAASSSERAATIIRMSLSGHGRHTGPPAAAAAAAANAAHFIHCPDAARSPFAPTRRRRAPKSATEGGMEVRTARDAWGGG